MKFKNKYGLPGFTLIELLVVIAIIGILMGAVVVGINPTERLQDARDANKKTIIASIGAAMEACYTVNEGSYTNCDTVAELVPNYLKQDPTTGVAGTWSEGAGCAAVTLENGADTHWKYENGRATDAAAGC